MLNKYFKFIAFAIIIVVGVGALQACTTDEPALKEVPVSTVTECVITFNEDFMESVNVTACWIDCEGIGGCDELQNGAYRIKFRGRSLPNECGVVFFLSPKDEFRKQRYTLATEYKISVSTLNKDGMEIVNHSGKRYSEFVLSSEEIARFDPDSQYIPLTIGVDKDGTLYVPDMDFGVGYGNSSMLRQATSQVEFQRPPLP